MVAQRVHQVTHHPVAAICRALRIARQTAYYTPAARARGHYRRAVDATVLQQIHAVTNSRATTRRYSAFPHEADEPGGQDPRLLI